MKILVCVLFSRAFSNISEVPVSERILSLPATNWCSNYVTTHRSLPSEQLPACAKGVEESLVCSLDSAGQPGRGAGLPEETSETQGGEGCPATSQVPTHFTGSKLMDRGCFGVAVNFMDILVRDATEQRLSIAATLSHTYKPLACVSSLRF